MLLHKCKLTVCTLPDSSLTPAFWRLCIKTTQTWKPSFESSTQITQVRTIHLNPCFFPSSSHSSTLCHSLFLHFTIKVRFLLRSFVRHGSSSALISTLRSVIKPLQTLPRASTSTRMGASISPSSWRHSGWWTSRHTPEPEPGSVAVPAIPSSQLNTHLWKI